MRPARLALLLLTGCGATALPPANDTGECQVGLEGRQASPIDLLVVLDGGSASAALRGRSAAALAALLRNSYPGGADPRALDNPPWLQVAIAADGQLLHAPGARSYLEWRSWLPNGGNEIVVEAALADRVARVPPTRRGPGLFETALAVIEQERAAPSGFLRDHVSLMVVFVTAEDDRSRMTPVDAYARLGEAYSSDGANWAHDLVPVSWVAACEGLAAPPRVSELVAQDRYAPAWDLCGSDPAGPLHGGIIFDYQLPCMRQPVGALSQCVVIDQTQGKDGQSQRRLPLCDGATTPCFRFDPEPACPSGTLRLIVDRGPDYLAPPGTTTLAACECRAM